MTFIQKNNFVASLLLLLFVLGFVFSFNKVEANSGAYGWFSPKVIYVSDTPATAGCAPDQASLEIWLVELNTQNQIAGNSGDWNVKVRNSKTDTSILSQKNLTAGTKTSAAEIICFDPSVNGLQVNVKESTSYHPFSGPTLFPNETNLDSMKGKHFRGFVELEPKSDGTPSVEAIYPDGDIVDGNPEFKIKTNSLSKSYGANMVDNTKIFVINQANTDKVVSYSDGTDYTSGILSIPTSGNLSLPEGVYYWTFHQELNGQTTTKKVSLLWTFSQIPSSGAPAPLSFTIDRSAPNSEIEASVASISPVTLAVKNTVGDLYSGLDSTTINVEDLAGNLVYSETKEYKDATITHISTYEIEITDINITIGNTYNIYTETIDRLGHKKVTPKAAITILANYDKPVISDLNIDESAIPNKITAHVITNGSVVTKWGSCWSLKDLSEDAFFTDPSAICKHNINSQSGSFDIKDDHNSIPNGKLIFYMAYAENLGGRQIIKTSGTLIGTANANPIVEFVAPTSILANSLNPGIKIKSVGSSALSKLGICYFNTSSSRDSSNISTLLESEPNPSNCGVWSTNIKPDVFFYRKTFDSLLSPDTNYYFKVFAQNNDGNWGFANGEYKTNKVIYKFAHLIWISPFIFGEATNWEGNPNFNYQTETYNEVQVRVAADDQSTVPLINPNERRTVKYTVYLDYNWDKITEGRDDTWSGWDAKFTDTISTHINGQKTNPVDLLYKFPTFNNVPFGPIYTYVKFHDADTSIPSGSTITYVPGSHFVTLPNLNIPSDSLIGSEGSGSSILVVDPGLKLWAEPNLVRVGESSTIKWSMTNMGSDLSCTIKGPKNTNTFPTSGTGAGSGTYSFTFNHTTNTNLNGSISSGKLDSAQVFELKCLAGTEVFSTTTRVTTLGTIQEI